jgi:hypothetical protein
MTESIRELNAGELELVAGGNVFGTILTAATGVAGAVIGGLFPSPVMNAATVIGCARDGYEFGTLVGTAVSNWLEIDN